MDNKRVSVTSSLFFQIILFIIVTPLLPLLISRHWDWWEAWIYAFISIAGFIVSRILAGRRNPDLIVERSRYMQQPNTKSWDKAMAPLLGILGFVLVTFIGLDELLGWSPAFSMPVKITALIILLAGYVLGSYALIENRFFSGTVRIQSERGHSVVSSGPYRWVRHPGYAGGILSYLATPFLLDSWFALIPAVMLCVVLTIRTRLEDCTLQAELEGYKEYASHVRYRLVPGVW